MWEGYLRGLKKRDIKGLTTIFTKVKQLILYERETRQSTDETIVACHGPEMTHYMNGLESCMRHELGPKV